MRRCSDVSELLAHLEQHGPEPAAIAFDADGTLWDGDVGEHFFDFALREGLFRTAALPALQALAAAHHQQLVNEPTRQAAVLMAAWRQRQIPEPVACEFMAWAFAGWSHAELHPHVNRALDEFGLTRRYFTPLSGILRWAQARGHWTFVVSASPSFVVEPAVQHLGIAPQRIAACCVAQAAAVLLPRLNAPLPYAEGKVRALQPRLQGRHLLAAFGDNHFDEALLRSARVAVAVRPKPAAAPSLARVPGVWLLS